MLAGHLSVSLDSKKLQRELREELMVAAKA
jgi:hypothetical protein